MPRRGPRVTRLQPQGYVSRHIKMVEWLSVEEAIERLERKGFSELEVGADGVIRGWSRSATFGDVPLDFAHPGDDGRYSKKEVDSWTKLGV